MTADTCQEAVQMLNGSGIWVVVCDTNLHDGTWRDILSSARNVTLVVSSRCPDEYLWAEVLNLGGFDVITKPFDKRELHHVLQTACLVTKTEQSITTDR
jgi:DNA-binding response OmpR family regulator